MNARNTLPRPPISTPSPARPRTSHLSVVPLPSTRTIQIQHTTAVRRGASWTADHHLQLTVAAVAGLVLVVVAAALSWLVAQMAAARWSVQPASSGRALSPWSVRPGHLPWRRSPGRVQHAVSTHPVPSSGVRRSSRPVSGRLASSVSSVQPVRCPAVRCPPVRWSAGCCPPPSVRTRPSHPTSGGGVVDQVGAAGNLHHRNGSRSRWASRGGAARSTAQQARTRATLPGSRVGQWGSVADPGRVG